jgi:protein involved in polysaccharide export with SLBB domain
MSFCSIQMYFSTPVFPLSVRSPSIAAIVLTTVFLLPLALPASVRAQDAIIPSSNPASLIHYGDLIEVDVVGSLEFDWRGRLTPEGFFDGMEPMGEQIFALCRSTDDVALAVEGALSRILRDPKVVIRIIDRSGRPTALIEGAVRNSYRFQINRDVRLNELIVLSGGITDRASGQIRLFRPPSAGCVPVSEREDVDTTKGASFTSDPFTRLIDLSDLLSGNSSANPRIFSGDVVSVLEALPVFVIGGVANPTRIMFREEMTLSRAVASAGGVSRNGVESEVVIYRRNRTETAILEFDLRKIASSETSDPVLEAYDIVDVGERGRGRRAFPPVVEGSPREGYSTPSLKVID